MEKFDPSRLKQMRLQKSLSVTEMASRLEMSAAQVHRLEKGERRLTVDVLLKVCYELGIDVGQLFTSPSKIPITGIINEDFDVQALPPNSEHSVWVPASIPNPENLAAVRWEASGHISRISGHLAFYYTHQAGIPEQAWNNRCLIVLEDKIQCLGWLIEQDGVTHIDNPDGRTKFNVDVLWASPIVAVVPPFVVHAP
jgi:transcriptional regulator with XRE-family HTH domain